MKPPSRLPDIKTQNDMQINLDLDMEINKDIKENSPYQEGIISEIYQKTRYITTGRTTMNEQILVNTNNIVQKCLPKQTDIDKILKIIQRRC